MDCVMTTDYITERWDYELLKKFGLQVIVFIVCLRRTYKWFAFASSSFADLTAQL